MNMPEGVEVLIVGEALEEFFHSKDEDGLGYVNLVLEKIYSEASVRSSAIPFTDFNQVFGKVFYKNMAVFGKNIFIPGSNGHSMVVQLGMTGTFSTSLSKYSRLKFLVNEEYELYYEDIRKFGYVSLQEKLTPRIQLMIDSSIDWRDEKLPKKLYPKIQKRKTWKNKEIKVLLLNQFVIAGIGNIYASESLFQAGINPKTLAGSLSSEECVHLGTKVQELMWKSYGLGGMTIKNFSAFGKKGLGKNLLRVYSKNGAICQVCEKAQIQKITQDGRATWFCPVCQPTKD
jgi:formamidopyrimidine-DNA glycosylase